MSFEMPTKEILWENQRKEIENSADALGYKIDDKIKETVVAFNALGLSTSASCEGHLDHGISVPWIEVSAENEPEERFIGEKEIFQKVADKYSISFDDVKKGINHEAWAEALKESSENDETPEYKKWREETEKLKVKTSKFLEEFYQNREIKPNNRLGIYEGGEGEFRIHNSGEDYKPVPDNLTEKQKKELSQRLVQYQGEMNNFTNFLRNKFFSE